MINYAQKFVELMQSDEGGQSENSTRRNGGFGALAGVSAARLKSIFAIIFRDSPKAAGSELFRMFRSAVERKLKVRIDYFLDERLWAIVEAQLRENGGAHTA